MMECVTGLQEPIERAPSGYRWNNLSNKVNKVLMDYNPNYKVSIT